jgi:hypothetical protein
MLDTALPLQVAERLLETVAVDSVDDLAVHLDQTPVRVPREPVVRGRARQALDRRVVQPEVEDRVHHPRHRDRGTGADGDEQRVARVSEALAGLALEDLDVPVDLLVEAGGKTALAHVGATGIRRDREAGRHRNAELSHLGQAGTLSPE